MNTKPISFSGFSAVLLTALIFVGAPGATSAQDVHSGSDPVVREAWEDLKQGRYRKAARKCKDTEGFRDEDQEACLMIRAMACNRRDDHNGAEEAARELIERTESPILAALGHRELGSSLAGRLRLISKKWPLIKPSEKSLRLLSGAEEALRKSYELSGGEDGTVQILLADVLTALMLYDRQWELESEIREILLGYLKTFPDGPDATWARTMSCTSERYSRIRRTEEPPTAIAEANPETQKEVGGSLGPLRVGGKVTQPQRVKSINPQYSELARRARLRGVVILETIIDTEGKVKSTRPLKGLPLCLTEEAMLAIQDWEFEPATLEGKPVEVVYHLTTNFWLEGPRGG